MKQRLKDLKKWFFGLSWWKKTLVIIVLIVAIFFVSAPLRPKQAQYTTAKVEKTNITEVVTETGNIATNSKTDVYSPTNGVVTDISVQNGQSVNQEDTLFTVKSSATDQEKADATAALLAAQSTLGTAQATMYSLQSAMYTAWNTYYQLATNSTYQNSDGSPNISNRALPQFTTAQTTWLAAEALYKNQQAVVNQAGAAAASAKLKYDATRDATVKAPIAGTVSNLTVGINDTVQAKTTTTPPALSIANFSATQVQIGLGEADIAKVKVGQFAEINVSSVPDKTYKGVVDRVDSIGTATQSVITYNVYITITNPDNNLRPGMTADTSITTKEVKDVLAVPNSAVKPYLGGRAVRIPGKNGQVQYVSVQIGVKGETNTQITSGLTDGETIITALANEAVTRTGLFGR